MPSTAKYVPFTDQERNDIVLFLKGEMLKLRTYEQAKAGLIEKHITPAVVARLNAELGENETADTFAGMTMVAFMEWTLQRLLLTATEPPKDKAQWV